MNLRPFHAAMIAGTHSSVGKTTWSLALMAFFRRKGLEVQPFKVGPDYIDPGFHDRICHPRKSRNLDRFFLSKDYLKDCFEKNSSGSDLALAEGVMGLFDGRSSLSEEGSTAEMAKLLGLSVFLVIDGAGLARSAAALVQGYHRFDADLNLAGVFINRVGSEGHFRLLREAVEKETGIPVLGWLPADSAVSIPERHLGLRTALEENSLEEKLARLGRLLEGRFDDERFLRLCKSRLAGRSNSFSNNHRQCRIGVARDKAFSFYYEDNFDLLREAGSELVFFSPLTDSSLPEDLDALYLGGGFPELYARELAANTSMKTSIQAFHEAGGIIYAECGGLIYLAEFFMTEGREEVPLIGLVPGRIRMTDRLQRFGYHELEALTDTFLFSKGQKLRSHEFHYSIWEVEKGEFKKLYALGGEEVGFYDRQILASYQHLHFGQDPELAQNFVQAAQKHRRRYVSSDSHL